MNGIKDHVWLEGRRQEALSAAVAALPAAMIAGFEGYYDDEGSRATRMLARYLIGEYAATGEASATCVGDVLASFDDSACSEDVGMAVARAAVGQARELRCRIALLLGRRESV